MPIIIPDSVFDKYFDVVDSTFTIFGVDCKLVYIEKVEEIADTFDNVPDNRSINPNRRRTDDFRREDKVYKEVEVYETVRIKVYWDRKSWVQVGKTSIVAPDNAIQTIFFTTDLGKIMRAKEMIVHNDISDETEMRFQRTGEPFPMGLKQTRYFGCFWERS